MKVYKLFLGIFVSIGLLIALSICVSAEFKTTYYPEEMRIEVEASGEYTKSEKTFAAAYLNGKMLNVSPLVTDNYGDSSATIIIDEEPEYVKVFSFDANLCPNKSAKRIEKKSFVLVENGMKTKTIAAADVDFDRYIAGKFTYEDADGQQEIELADEDELVIYYNDREVGVASTFKTVTSSAFSALDILLMQAEELTFSGAETDVYDKIFVTDYVYDKVKKVYAKESCIVGENFVLELDPEIRRDEDFTYRLLDEKGNEIAISDIAEDDLLNIVAPLTVDKTTGEIYPDELATIGYMDIYVTNNKITGMVTEDFLDGRYAIDGVVYETVTGVLSVVNIESDFFITIDGRIYGYDVSSTISKNFGFIVFAYSEGKYDNTVFENVIRMFTADDEIVNYTVADSLKINGMVVPAGRYTGSSLNTIVGETIKSLCYDNAISEENTQTNLYKRLVKYKLNENGEIKELSFSGAYQLTMSTNDAIYRSDLNTFGAKKIEESTKLFIAPVTEVSSGRWNVDEDDIRLVSFDSMNNGYSSENTVIVTYDFLPTSLAVALLSSHIETSFADSHFAVVKLRSSVYDEEYDTLVKYTFIQSGETVSLTVSPEANNYDAIDELSCGDVVLYTVDYDGMINNIHLVYDASEKNFNAGIYTQTNLYSNKFALVYGEITDIEDGIMTIDAAAEQYVLGNREGNTYALIEESSQIKSADISILQGNFELKPSTPARKRRAIAILSENSAYEDCIMTIDNIAAEEIVTTPDYIYGQVNKVYVEDLYVSADRFDLELDPEIRGNKNFTYNLFDADGKTITIADIKENDILNIVIPKGMVEEYDISTAEHLDIYVTSETITGRLEEVDIEGNYYIDGKQYKSLSPIYAGAEGTFYITIDDKILAYDASSALSRDFGFIVRAYSEGKCDNTVFENTIRMFTADGDIVNFSVADRLKVTGTVVPAGTYQDSALNTVVGTIIKSLCSDNTTSKADAQTNLYKRLVTYKLNDNGEIKELSFAGDEIVASVGNKVYRDDVNTFGSKKITDRSVLFIAPVGEIYREVYGEVDVCRWNVDEEDLKIGNFDILDEDKAGGYAAATYTFQSDAKNLAVALVSETITESFKGKHLAVVKSRSVVYDAEYDLLVKYTFIQSGETISITVSPEAIGTVYTDLSSGDIVLYTVDDKQMINNMHFVYDASERTLNSGDYTTDNIANSKFALVSGEIPSIEDSIMTVSGVGEYLLGECEGNTYALIEKSSKGDFIDVSILQDSSNLKASTPTKAYTAIAILTEDDTFEDVVMIVDTDTVVEEITPSEDYIYCRVISTYPEEYSIAADNCDVILDGELRGNKNFTYNLFDADGETIAFEDIKKGDILNVVIPEGTVGEYDISTAEHLDIYVTNNTITGRVTEDFLDGRYAINGNVYAIVSGYLPSGAEGTFYITIDDKILAYDASSALSRDFGFIVRAYSEGKYDNTVFENTIRMFTADGEIVNFSVADRLKVTGTVVPAGTYIDSSLNTVVGTTIKSFCSDNTTSKADAQANLYKRLVTYKLNDNGEIKELSFAGDEIVASTGDKVYRDDVNTFGSKKITDSSVLFVAPVGEIYREVYGEVDVYGWNVDEDDLRIAKFSKMDEGKVDGYAATTYVFNADAKTLAAALASEQVLESFKGTHFAVVQNRGSIYDEEYDALVKYTFIQSGEIISLTVSPEAIGTVYTDLSSGDIVLYTVDDKQMINNMHFVYDASERTLNADDYTMENIDVRKFALVFGEITSIEDEIMTVSGVGSYPLAENENNTYASIDATDDFIRERDVTKLIGAAALRASTSSKKYSIVSILTKDDIYEDCVMIFEYR